MNALTNAVRTAKLSQTCRDAYASGQSSISTEEDPEGTIGHQAGLDAVFTYLLYTNLDQDLITQQNVDCLMTDIGA